MIALAAQAGRTRDFPLAQATRSLELVLEDRGRKGSDDAEGALHLVRVQLSDPRGDGYYRRTFLLGSGQRVVLDMATVDTLQASVLSVEGCTDGRRLVISQLTHRPPDVADRLLDAVVYDVASTTTQFWTPPPGARRWWAADGGAGVGPVPQLWHLAGDVRVTAGGTQGEVLGPVFTADKVGTAKLIWEVVP